jgi:DNA mismatch repair protein MutL
MSKIRILPENLSNKIAAGEVVERPSSVVKELVENALDAGSTRVIIEVEKGGRSLIRVSDNGSGMNHDDALLALERYATSKIFKDEDLFSIQTLGFRGEALPSIAAVSRFSLISRDETSDSGTEIIVEGGKIKTVSEVGAPKGTMISVKQLFFNTPARRKFLKTIGTEMSHIADTAARMALGHPDVQFRLLHNNKPIKSWTPTAQPVDRVVDVLGRDLKPDLHPMGSTHNGIDISGWIASPRVTRRTSRGLYIYVNGRFVRDKTIQHGLFAGYSQRIVKGQFPVAVVFISVAFDQVDVNVHPIKNEVRFVNPHRVHEAVRNTVAQTLYEVDRLQWGAGKYTQDGHGSEQSRVSEAVEHDFGFRISDIRVKDDKQKPGNRGQSPEDSGWIPESGSQIRQTPLWEKGGFRDLRVVGQLHNTYILCESDQGLVLIDQHAAHERILYERLSRRSAEDRTVGQNLLVPETIDLGYHEADMLAKIIPDLAKLGLDVEPFGGNTFVIKSVPALLSGHEVKPLVIEIVEKMAATETSADLNSVLDHCRMVMACHGAIRAHQSLTDQQLKDLLYQLDECENPSHCPHGRPTWIRWDLSSLEKSFKRIV